MKKAKFWLAIALVLCLVSSVGASLFQTDFGKIEYHDLTFVTQSGHELDALLLVPENATAANPAPAIVVSHGWYNNREMQDLNYVEYARRGFVVLAISMYGHGDSEVIASNTWWNDENNANGLYDGVKYLASLPFVDASRIGVTGHSNGALACREAVLQDEEGLIALLHRVGDIENHIGIAQRTNHKVHHRLLQLVVGFQHSGCVREHDLHVLGVDDTHDTVAGGLCLEGGDRDAFTDKLVHQCRLTHIGVSHDIYESCFVHSSVFLPKKPHQKA